jgi:serine/threonine protein kinase
MRAWRSGAETRSRISPPSPRSEGEIARLEELRLAAMEHRISTELAMGSHTTVVSELDALTARYPLRERLWAHLMLALYQGGRQAEALHAYERARRVLESELGADPSLELQHLYEQILSHDPAIKGPITPVPPSIVSSSLKGDLEPSAEFAGFRIVRIIGRGGMGVVYLAEHENLKRKVALKLLAPQLAEDPRFRERFVRESQLAASIDHPNVIPIYEAGESDGRLYIAMRYVEGTDLRTFLREQGTLDPAKTSQIVSQIAAALDAAHEQGLVHRDVKPANVLIARQRGPEAGTYGYLTDFGLTKRASSDSGVTGTGQFVGTLDYAAPEQFKGDTPTARTDVYSLGCVLFECLAGHPPFQAGNDAGLMYAHLQDDPPALTTELPDLPREIDVVIAKAMAKEPADRYQTAGRLADEASAALGYGGQAIPLPPESSKRGRAWRRWLVPGLGAGLLIVIVAITLAGEPNGSTPNADPSGSVAASGAEGPAFIPSRDVASIDPKDGRLLAAVGGIYLETLDGAVSPDVAFAEGKLWVIDAFSVSEIDPANASIQPGAPLASQDPRFRRVVVAGDGYVLLTDGFLEVGSEGQGIGGGIGRIDPTSGAYERKSIDAGAATGLDAGAGAIWETFEGGVLVRIGARGLSIMRVANVGGTLDAVGADDSSVWVGDSDRKLVWRVDPQSFARSEPIDMDGAVDAIAALRGVAWVLDRTAATVTPVGATFGEGQPIRVGESATDIEAGLGAIWVSDRGGSLWRVDPETRETSTIDVGYPVETLSFDPKGRVVWMLVVSCPLSGTPQSASPDELGCT